ncbi:MAG: hypothetical protein AB1485_09910, partial [Candidatus Thermoplasmatota archaeon]
MATYQLPVDISKAEKMATKRLTVKQLFILIVTFCIAVLIAAAFPFSDADKFLLFLFLYAAFALPVVVRHKDVPLYTYVKSTLSYRRVPKIYEKAKGKTALFPPTQNFIGIADVIDDIAVKDSKNYFAGLKITPIDLAQRMPDKQDDVFSAYLTACNTLDFYTQTVIDVQPYDPTPYTAQWEEKAACYPPESKERETCKLNAQCFSEDVKFYQVPQRSFYLLIPIDLEEEAPELIEEEKVMVKSEKDLEKKRALREDYKRQKYEAASEILRIRKSVAAGALQQIDSKVVVE